MEENQITIKSTTFWDFLIALGSGFVNLLKLEKVICIIVLYLLGRDIFFSINIDKGNVYRENIIDAGELIKLILESDKSNIIFISVIIILIIIIVILIATIRFVYMKEIDRLSNIRRKLIHDMQYGNFTPLKEHHSSDRR